MLARTHARTLGSDLDDTPAGGKRSGEEKKNKKQTRKTQNKNLGIGRINVSWGVLKGIPEVQGISPRRDGIGNGPAPKLSDGVSLSVSLWGWLFFLLINLVFFANLVNSAGFFGSPGALCWSAWLS